ncbi:MAG: phosphoribosylformylglycinamidine synthase subunit PurL [Candidatus Tectomicrobia bacterium]|uniref:Phosphoribosylformylglycinamidine synthase subunit PurL n=1 Tax=Tectimicrobiota bacterium TaxID=2528274 RepID=A0A932GR60_UNCTE|nr:phosphoribosylformylglycinamidine synthase subunit PurL [Candidatus Tectomicrobia bacterium]
MTPELIAAHGLTAEEYRILREILGREPTLTELGIFSVMWSEHCSYKSSRIYLKELPTQGSNILQGPGENAGVVDIGEGLVAVFKIESHNHPSFIEPYQGAATGVGGILRDIFTMGARPLALMDSLRFGPLEEPRNRYLLSGVVAGIGGYGNCIGVPTVGGETYFADCYSHNPLVNVFNLGIARRDRIFTARAAGVGNPVIYVGSKTGRDGIHGATMASESFHEGSEERRPTVQVGDPFTEKLLLEACLEIMKTDALVGIQDMGAAGLTCSTVEMAARGEVGIEIDVARVPQREEGMSSYEIMLSESQERMLLVAKEGREEEVLSLFSRWDLDAVVIGRVTEEPKLTVRDRGRVVAQIPVAALTEDAPLYRRPVSRPGWLDELGHLDLQEIPDLRDGNESLLRIVASPNIASKAWIYEQYDYLVRLNSLVLPGADAAVIRVPGTSKALAMSLDGNGRFCYLNPRQGAMLAVAEGARNVVCAGAKPLAISNCLNFGNPENPEIMWQFAEAVRGMGDACRLLGTPVTGGNVSFYNETEGNGIYPTVVIAMVGLLDDQTRVLTPWFQNDGDEIFLLGPFREELGGSEYLNLFHHLVAGQVPSIDLEMEKKVQGVCLQTHQAGWLLSAHDCAEGGLAVALAECCIGGPGEPRGARIHLEGGQRLDGVLYGETPSRLVLTTPPQRSPEIEALARHQGVPCLRLGTVGGTSLQIRVQGRKGAINLPVAEIRRAWQNGIHQYFEEQSIRDGLRGRIHG